MKRCPECRRDYYDDTLLYCLDDGNALLEGPASGGSKAEPPALDHPTRHKTSGEAPGASGQFGDEPLTAILHETAPPDEAATQAQIHTTDHASVLPSAGIDESRARRINRRMLLIPVLLLVAMLGVFFGYRYFYSENSDQIESIAVLPFENASGNPDLEYLSDGMAETLIGSLSQLPNLSVKPRSSVFRYKGKDASLQAIGKELNVQAILTGRVVQRGDQLTLGLELVEIAKDIVIWSGQYNRKQDDLVSLQAEIARDVSSKLKARLSGAEEQKIAKPILKTRRLISSI